MLDSYCVYILRCVDGTLYTGYTSDLQRRVAQHQSGKGGKYTRSRRPVVLLGFLPMEGRREAMRREQQIKQMHRVDKLRLLAGSFDVVAPDAKVLPEECGIVIATHS